MQPKAQQSQQTPSVESALVTLGVLALAVLLLAALNAFPAARRTSIVNADGVNLDSEASADTAGIDGEAAAGPASGGGGGGANGGGATGAGATGGGGPAGSCKGGATDVGVTGDSIKLGATVVDSGIGSSFLGPVRIGMVAVQQKVNRAGGICGRKLNLIMKDDGWDRQRGFGFIRNLVEDDKVFALAVVPSSEGLDNAADYVDKMKVPVVGTDGMLASQYTRKWIWPVATSTISLMHIIAKEAHERGARHFSLVYDRQYRFGLEGAYAYNQAVKRLTGSDIPGYEDPFSNGAGCRERFCGILAGESSYNSQAETLRRGCEPINGTPCDSNALLLEPTEALTWYNSGGREPKMLTLGAGAAQTLFTKQFADQCQAKCDRLVIWSGFNPPIERFAGLPQVKQYVADIRAQSPTADVNNQFLEGGYVGMILLVEALQKVGANLTRETLRQQLDTMTLDTGLTQPLKWTGNHFANKAAQGFRVNYTGTFGGWTEVTKGWIDDPWVGQDIVSGK